MIEELPVSLPPVWLSCAVEQLREAAFPLESILRNSFFYPASGFDGRPLEHLAGNAFSFVYVDYGVTRAELLERASHVKGYRIILSRQVDEELFGASAEGGQPRKIRPRRDSPESPVSLIKEPFSHWLVFERGPEVPYTHGPVRFSLVFLCADGVSAFEALYVRNRLVPIGVGIIQPGHGFGGNWTNFEDPEGELASLVLNNSAGKPDFLLFGGIGPRKFYKTCCWPHYSKFICFLGQENIGAWKYQVTN